MIWNLSNHYIHIQDRDFSYTYGLPYCVLLFSMAFLGNVTVFILCVIEAVREHRRQISQNILSELGGTTTSNTVNTSLGAYSRFP